MPLVLIGTPIGNLGDLSPRAVDALGRAELICCEDTRRTGRLLQHAGLAAKRLLVVNDHTEGSAADTVLAHLAAGEMVALVTDAGMPGISDPGEVLVRRAVEAGHAVEVVPGPTAAIAALVASGLPSGRFVFEGFLPRKGQARSARVAEVAAEPRTTVLYEAPHRLGRTVADLSAACGPDRRVVVARELTKLHEELWRGTLAGAVEWVAQAEPRGEIVLVLDGAPPPAAPTESDLVDAVKRRLDAGDSARDAAVSVAAELSVPKRTAYALAVEMSRR